MPFVLPADPAAGAVAPASWGDDVRAALNFLANPPSCRVYHNATQSAGDASGLSPVLFNSEYHDTDGMHSASADTGRLTINTAGVYIATFSFQLTGAGDYIYVQGGINSSVAGGTFLAGQTTQCNAAPYEPWVTVTTPPTKLAAADYLIATAFQDNTGGAARNIKATSCTFGATWVGLG